MKSNRGVTLTSLVIYIAGLTLIIALMGTFTGYFFNNLNEATITQNSDESYSKFLAYITKDINSDDLVYIQSGVNNEDCVILKFGDGEEHQYIYQNKKIYYLNIDSENEKKITLCSNVSVLSTTVFSYLNGTLGINLKISDESYSNSLTVNI